MAQDAQRPARHTRHSSRIATLMTGSWKSTDVKNTRESRTSRQDDGTTKYIKRTLCAPNTQSNQTAQDIERKPLRELLPPLTSSNEVDLQLYALIAVIINQFVQAWYNKITPDQDFVAEVVKIIAHCTRGLEQRLRNVDLEALVLDELPLVAECHIEAVRKAIETSNTSIYHEDTRIIFNTLRKHVALSPPPISPAAENILEENETAWCRLLVDRVMPLLLPPEDLENPCLQLLVSDIFAEMVVHNGVCGKTCESWLIWEGLTKIIHLLRPEIMLPGETAQNASPISRLEQFGLLAANPSTSNNEKPQLNAAADSITSVIWLVLQYIVLTFTTLRSFTLSLMHASSLPARSIVTPTTMTPTTTNEEIPRQASPGVGLETIQSHPEPSRPRPIIAMNLWSCISLVLSLGQRMPWLSGLLSLLQSLSLTGPGQICRVNGALDRLASYHVHQGLFNESLLPILLQTARDTVFPDNALAPPRHMPDEAQSLEIKHECARAIVDAIPPFVRERFFATADVGAMRQDVETNILDLFSDTYINKHLIFSIVELVMVRAFPELEQHEV